MPALRISDEKDATIEFRVIAKSPEAEFDDLIEAMGYTRQTAWRWRRDGLQLRHLREITGFLVALEGRS